MTIFKRLFDFYIQSSIHVGLAVFSLVYSTAFENDLCKHITYPSCVLFGTILCYNFLKYFDVYRKGKFKSLKYYGIILVCLFSLYGFYFFFRIIIDAIKVQLILGGILVLVYPLLRKHGILKMFFVSFVVAYLTAFVYIIKSPMYHGIAILDFAKRFVLISALMIPFEIYDSQHDDKAMNTLPQKFGIETAKKFGYFILLLFVVMDVVNFNFNGNIKFQYLFIDILIVFVIAISIYFSSIKRNQYYTSFWVESIPILWWVLLFMVQ